MAGASAGAPKSQQQPAKVTLHVYDFLEQGLNGILRQIGTGGFHVGVEVFGREWSYRRTHFGTGVFWINPRTCTAHKYRESVPMGKVSMSPDSFSRLVEEFKRNWPGTEYDILKRNCCVFANEFCKRLGVGPIPDWITNLAGVGADMRSVVRRPLRQIEGAITGESPDKKDKKHTPPPAAFSASGRVRNSGRFNSHTYEELKHGATKTKVQWVPWLPLSSSELWKCVLGILAFVVLLGGCLVAAVLSGRLKAYQFGQLLRGGRPGSNAAGTASPYSTPAYSPATSYAPALTPTPASYQPSAAAEASTKPLFDCSHGFDTWRADWSAEKLGWCCMHDESRCPVARGRSKYDCAEGYTRREVLWSAAKQDWCCQHKGLGCPVGAEGSTSGTDDTTIGVGIGVSGSTMGTDGSYSTTAIGTNSSSALSSASDSSYALGNDALANSGTMEDAATTIGANPVVGESHSAGSDSRHQGSVAARTRADVIAGAEPSSDAGVHTSSSMETVQLQG